MKCCFCLCTKNSGFALRKVLYNIRVISTLFEETRILAAYEVSSDDTLAILQEDPSIQILMPDSEPTPSRTTNIANARNRLLKHVPRDYEYFVMMDTNEYSCIGDVNLETLQEVFETKDYWDSISFNREAGYYDFWALSYEPYMYSYNHFVKWKDRLEQMRTHFNKILEATPNQHIQVYSAFNGFAIYKTSIFVDILYSSDIDLSLFPTKIRHYVIRSKKDDCEHRGFHLRAIKERNARIYIYNKSVFKKIHPPPNLRGPV
jgi:hypothetical protein